MKHLRFFLLFSLLGIAYSQNENEDKSFFLSLSGGTAINNPVSHYFFRETNDRLINPGFYTSIAFGYGAFDLIELTQLYLSFSIGYTKVSTSEFQLEYFPSKAKLIIETFPMLFWSRLQTNTKLSPFVEIGIGFSKLNFIERYSDWLNGASFSYWALGYGFGAGLNYRLSKSFELALIIRSLTNENEKIVENDRDHKSGIFVRNITVPICIRINYKF